ncbi:TPA: hypothetical protein ACH3X1_003147 [Trebouxia sp. C0004]
MQPAFEHRCSPITKMNGCGITRRSHPIAPEHGGSCAHQQRTQRLLTRASDHKSKSHKETDTSPEGKGEQREQPANRTDGRTTWTKLRVERQTHLPASREEAWQALQSLLPKKEWKETSAVFASLEAIYRAELQQTGEELLSALSLANGALEYIPPVTNDGITVKSATAKTKEIVPGLEPPKPPSPPQNKPPQDPPSKSSDSKNHSPASDSGASASADSRQDSHKHASTSGRDGTASNAVSNNGSASSASKQSDQDGSEQCSDSRGSGGSGLGDGARSEKVKHAVSAAGDKMQQAVQKEGNGIGSRLGFERLVQDSQLEADELRNKAQQAVRHKLATETDAPEDKDTSSGGGKALVAESIAQGKMLLMETAEPSDEAIILPTSSVDITDVSRMGFDLRRKASLGDRNKVDPQEADRRFVQLLVELLVKAHFVKFTGRDAAMSKSLNSDYLSQLYIRADTKSMDKDLVRDEVVTSGLPEEAQALVVFKRGYGQARRRGRMISAKVDFLQLLVVKATVGRLAVSKHPCCFLTTDCASSQFI